MEDVYILYNIIKKNLMKKSIQDRKMRAFWPFEAPHDIGTIV
jgi:hypothetical protein